MGIVKQAAIASLTTLNLKTFWSHLPS